MSLTASNRLSSRSKVDQTAPSLNVKGTKAMFENGQVVNHKRQRAPSPAPVRMSMDFAQSSKRRDSIGSVSSFKEKFEQIYSKQAAEASVRPRSTIRRTASVEEDINEKNDEADRSQFNSLPRTSSGSRAEQYWMQARSKLITDVSTKKSTANSNKKQLSSTKPLIKSEKQTSDTLSSTNTSISHTALGKDGSNPNVDTEKDNITSVHERISKLTQNDDHKPTEESKSSKATKRNEVGSIKSIWENIDKKSSTPKDLPRTVNKLKSSTTKNEKMQTNGSNAPPIKTSKGKSPDQASHKNHQVTDEESAKTFMKDLVEAIDNDQAVPLRQLITLFEQLHADNSDMKKQILKLKERLDSSDVDTLTAALQNKLKTYSEDLDAANSQIEELTALREALEQSEERCEELEDLNHQHLKEIESLRLEIDEMRDQFYDDEVHESIILQQRLDDMARSLRIIHFRLKKAEAKLSESEREKLGLLEEIRLLQGGTFTDEELRRMQALEGDLQSAKRATIDLHCQLEQSEERRQRVEMEAGRLRDELRDSYLENERLKNNLQLSRQTSVTSSNPDILLPEPQLLRQSSTQDVESLKSNLEASIEREADTKEQLKFAEDEAKMLRKRLRDTEHENEALSKQLKKITSQPGKDGKPINRSRGDTLQIELIQLENIEMRRNNDQLHKQIEQLQDQVKSFKQKIDLVTNEQAQGPLSASRNSLYYETKFEIMSQEIEDLRWQLQDKEKEIKKITEQTNLKSRRDQLRRAITLETDKVEPDKQLDIIKHESDVLQEKLVAMEKANSELTKENRQLQARVASHKVSSTDVPKSASRSEASSEVASSDDQQQKLYQEMECENTKLVSELIYYRDVKPDIAALVDGLQKSEEKILTYETEISNLRSDMFKMERNLQDDINSLTLKNSILKSLLEAINLHETSPPVPIQSALAVGPSGAAGQANGEEDERIIARHISRLPHDIQIQFREKIDALERQLKEERQRALAAEGLLQQVKTSAKTKRYTRTRSE